MKENNENNVVIWYEFDKDNKEHLGMLKKGTIIRTQAFEETLIYVENNPGLYVEVVTIESGRFPLVLSYIKQIGIPIKKSCETCRWCSENNGSGLGCVTERKNAGVYESYCDEDDNNFKYWEPILKPGMKMYVRSDANENNIRLCWVNAMDNFIGRSFVLESKSPYIDNSWYLHGDPVPWAFHEAWLTYKTSMPDKPSVDKHSVKKPSTKKPKNKCDISFVIEDEFGCGPEYKVTGNINCIFNEEYEVDKFVEQFIKLQEGKSKTKENVIKLVNGSSIKYSNKNGLNSMSGEITNIWFDEYQIVGYLPDTIYFDDEHCTKCFCIGDYEEIIDKYKETKKYEGEINQIKESLAEEDVCKYCLMNILKTDYAITSTFMCEGNWCEQAYDELAEEIYEEQKEEKPIDELYYFKAINDFYDSFTTDKSYKFKRSPKSGSGWSTTSNNEEDGDEYTWNRTCFKRVFGEDIYDKIKEADEIIDLFKQVLKVNNCYDSFYELVEGKDGSVDNRLRFLYLQFKNTMFISGTFQWPFNDIEKWDNLNKEWERVYKIFHESKSKIAFNEMKVITFREMKAGDKGRIVKGPQCIGEEVIKCYNGSVVLINSEHYDGWSEPFCEDYKVKLIERKNDSKFNITY